MDIQPTDYLEHYGVPGMKWGVRHERKQVGSIHGRQSIKGAMHRIAAANYELNAKTYSKMGNNTMASMNKAAAKASRKKAMDADTTARQKRAERLQKAAAKKADKKKPKSIQQMVQDDLDQNVKNRLIKSGAGAVVALGSAAAGSLISNAMYKRGDSISAAKTYATAKGVFDGASSYATYNAAAAGVDFIRAYNHRRFWGL